MLNIYLDKSFQNLKNIIKYESFLKYSKLIEKTFSFNSNKK